MGGGGGSVYSYTQWRHSASSGKGSSGTSFSGGTGGGSAQLGISGIYDYILKVEAGEYGSYGGYSRSAAGSRNWNYGGVGNPGGLGNGDVQGYDGSQFVKEARGNNGTGGLLVVYAKNISEDSTGKLTSEGVSNGRYNAGGSSGGGSINVFYEEDCPYSIVTESSTQGGISVSDQQYGKSGNGGEGTITVGNISTGKFRKITRKIGFTELMEDIDDDEQLQIYFSNEKSFSEMIEDDETMRYICETPKLRELMYNNYEITQEIIRNNDRAINIMMEYEQTLYKNSFNRMDSSNVIDVVLNKKVFLFKVRVHGYASGLNLGIFTDGTSPYCVAGSGGVYDNTVTINKFLSQIKGAKNYCNNDPNAIYYYLEI